MKAACPSGLHLPPVPCQQDLQLKLGEARSDSEAIRKQLDGKAAEAHRLAAELEAAHVQVCASAISVVFPDASSIIRPLLCSCNPGLEACKASEPQSCTPSTVQNPVCHCPGHMILSTI
jgi:hypothetical protein